MNYLTSLEQFRSYPTERGRIVRPVKDVGVYMSVDAARYPSLCPSSGARLTMRIGLEHVEAALAPRAAADHDRRARRLTVAVVGFGKP